METATIFNQKASKEENKIAEKVLSGKRISNEDAFYLY